MNLESLILKFCDWIFTHWVWDDDNQCWDLRVRFTDETVASVWLNGQWSTWDCERNELGVIEHLESLTRGHSDLFNTAEPDERLADAMAAAKAQAREDGLI